MNSETNEKSSRHSKITGNFGESLVLYWLSKHGFECAMVDHVGIDIIAAKDNKKKRIFEQMGISVKTRSRLKDQKPGARNIWDKESEKKARDICHAFGCKPYLAVVVDNTLDDGVLYIFVMPLQCAKEYMSKRYLYVGLSKKSLDKYRNDKDVLVVEVGKHGVQNNYEQKIKEWWKNHSRPEKP